jgi:HEAT repeat protein
MDEGIPAIAAHARDPIAAVRLEAAQQLCLIGGPRTLDPLVILAADADPEVQLNAIDGLINIYVPGYLKTGVSRSARRSGDTLTVRFNEPGDLVVDGYVRVSEPAIGAATKALRESRSLEVRANAARALGIFRAGSAVPELTEALYSKDDQLMYESLVALQKIRDASAGPKLAFLVRDLNEKVQVAALRAAGILRTQEAAPAIRTVIDDRPNPRVLRQAAESLAMIARPEDRGIFLSLLADRDEELRTAAAEGLARLKNSNDTERLSAAFESERSYSARLAAAFGTVSLGRLQMSQFSAFRYLIDSLKNNNYRSASLAYLTELARDSAVRQTLYTTLDDARRDEKTGLCLVFGESGEKDTVPHLNRLKDDNDVEVAQTCLRSLRTLEARLR